MILLALKLALVPLIALLTSKFTSLPAAHRHGVLLVCFICLPLVVLLDAVVPKKTTPYIPPIFVDWNPGSSEQTAAPTQQTVQITPPLAINFLKRLITLYGLITLSLLAYWGVIIARTQIWVQRTTVLGNMCRHGIHFQLRSGPKLNGPFAWGLRNKVIVVPDDWKSWLPSKQKAVLEHEVAHLQRHDIISSIFASIICSLFFFHPLAWLARRKLLMAAELACDDVVIRNGCSPALYAQELLNISKNMHASIAPGMTSGSDLSARIHAILNSNTRRNPMKTRFLSTLVIISVCLLYPLSSIGSERLETLIEGERFDEALVIVQSRLENTGLDANETNQLYNTKAYIHFMQNNYVEAINAYTRLLNNTPAIPKNLEASTAYSLAQLNYIEKKFALALGYIKRWQTIMGKSDPSEMFIAQLYYELGQFDKALQHADEAILLTEQRGIKVLPAWKAFRSSLASGEPFNYVQAKGLADSDYMLITMVPPIYPNKAQASALEGFVDVEFTVKANGTISDALVLTSQPPGIFDQAALVSVATSRYKPRVKNGESIAVAGAKTRVLFTLQQN